MLPTHNTSIVQRKLQNDNDSQLDELSQKIKQMTMIGTHIGSYIKKEEDLLKEISDKQGYSQRLLDSTLKRVQALMAQGQGTNLGYLLCLICLLFLILYCL